MSMPLGWRKPIEDRLAKYIKVSVNGCHEWTGALSNGYAIMNIDKKRRRVSHVVWERTHEVVPADKFMCHRCDNPKCVNPKHLFAGTTEENMKGAKSKGRIARGERLPQSKLTATEVRQIRASVGFRTPKEIETLFGISPRARRKVINRETWNHVS